VPTLQACIAAALIAQIDGQRSDSVGVLALGLPPGPGAEIVEIASRLRDAIAERRAGVLGEEQLRSRMSGPPAASLEELDAAFEGARAAYLAGDHEGSVRTLRSVVEELERLPDEARVFEQWKRAVARLARSELDLGRPEASRALLQRLVRAAPDFEADRGLFPGKLIQQLESVRSALRAEPTHHLAVAASSAGAHLYLNGREVGTAPADLTLPRGPYRLSGSLGSSRVLPIAVDLRGGDQSVFLDFTIPEAFRPDLGPGLALAEDDRSHRVVAAGGYLGFAEIVTVHLLQDAGASFAVGTVHDVRRGMLVRQGRVRLAGGALPPGGLRELAEFLVNGNASGHVEVPGQRRAVDLGPAPPLRALGWTALATGVAALGLTAFASAETRSASGSYAEARKVRAGGFSTYQAVVQYNRAVDRGDSARRAAAACWTGAGVAAVAAGVLGYVNYRRTGEIGPFRF
jgi:hypothetical protein